MSGMAGDAETVDVGTEISSRITTAPALEGDPPGLRVQWVGWDSAFRGTALRVGDLIVGVDGRTVTRPATGEEAQKTVFKLVGQYGEYQRWAEDGLHDGDPVTLRVRRRKLPQGWEELDVEGELRAERTWRNADGRRIFGPGGPDRDGRDEFPDQWEYWYVEKFVRRLSGILDGGWQRSINSRYELEQHLADKARVDTLGKSYAGPFADAVKADWETVHDLLAGTLFDVSEESLRYRHAGEERVEAVKHASEKAWAEFVGAHEAETIAAFPAVDPLEGDIGSVAGRCVVLPPIEGRDWIPEAGHNYFAVGNDGDGWYFADAESPASFRMLRAARRYERLVAPDLPPSYAVIGRILPDPRLLVMQDRGRFGLQFEPLAALAGDRMFVDLTKVVDGESPFHGEDGFSRPQAELPPGDATPAQVLEALVDSLKDGDQAVWKALYATWWTSVLDNGRVDYYPNFPQLREDGWQDGRRFILTDVYDVRVVWTGDVRQVSTGVDFEGAPEIDEVEAEVVHVGLFDGRYRAFVKIGLSPVWQLQRIDGGPWRITSNQPI
jgi:hypothetical protein